MTKARRILTYVGVSLAPIAFLVLETAGKNSP